MVVAQAAWFPCDSLWLDYNKGVFLGFCLVSHKQFQICLIKERKGGLLGGSVHIFNEDVQSFFEQPSSPSMWHVIT